METTLATRRSAADLKAPFRLIGAAVVLAVAAGAALILAPSFTGAANPQADTSYNQVEQIRGQVGIWSTNDSSYGQVETLRLQVTLPNQSVDTSYDEIERIRGQFGN
jgi:hypothetical protein